MGRVVLARDPALGRTVAVKILLDEGARDPETRARFLREAQLTAQLEHPNIMPVYALERAASGAPAFTMKVVRGRTFDALVAACREALKAGRPLVGDLALDARLEVFLRACDAVAYAHDRGVVHRDLKPDNLMLGAFGEVYVLDWGIAKVAGDLERAPRDLAPLPSGLTTATQAGMAIGTPAYMAPEQASGDFARLGPATDQYTLGLILQELITLERANDTGELTSTLARAMQAQRAPLRVPRGRPPADLVAIIARATRLTPAARYPSVAAFADDVRRYLHREETVARPDRLWRKPVRWTMRRPAAATALVLGVSLLAVLSVGVVTIGGVVGLAASQAAAHQRQEHLAALVRDVGAHAHRLDSEFDHYEALLERLAAVTAQLLEHGTPDPAPFHTLDDLRAGRAPSDFAHAARYDQGVTLDAPVVVLAPGVERASVDAAVRRLRPLVTELRGAVLRSHAADALTWPESEQRRVVLDHVAPVVWSYVGLEHGLLLNYPGNTRYSADYDARERSWYKEARGTHGPVWGAPFPDDSGMGLLLPCNQAVYAEDGAFLGVASVSLALARLVARLRPEALTGLRTAYLVDGDGMLVLASDQQDLDLWAGLNEGRAVDRTPFPDHALRARIIAERAGHHVEQGTITVWTPMDAVGWRYVAQIPWSE